MKSILFSITLLLSSISSAQKDTMIVYYENGQMEGFSPRLDGKANGTSKMWYESGELWSVSKSKHGEQRKTTRYYEDGKKRDVTRKHKWKMRLKMWHSNGQLWTTSKSKYARSFDREFDSTGALVREVIYKKGSSLTCSIEMNAEVSDSVLHRDGRCFCPWGNVYWRNGGYIDERGREMSSHFSSVSTEFYADGTKKKEMIWDKESKSFLTREWDENGVFKSESTD